MSILGAPMKRIKLGKTEIDQETFECWIAEMGSSQYRANQYELFKHNCNNFSEDVAQFLGNFCNWIFRSIRESKFSGNRNFLVIAIFKGFKFSENSNFRGSDISEEFKFSGN